MGGEKEGSGGGGDGGDGGGGGGGGFVQKTVGSQNTSRRLRSNCRGKTASGEVFLFS